MGRAKGEKDDTSAILTFPSFATCDNNIGVRCEDGGASAGDRDDVQTVASRDFAEGTAGTIEAASLLCLAACANNTVDATAPTGNKHDGSAEQ